MTYLFGPNTTARLNQGSRARGMQRVWRALTLLLLLVGLVALTPAGPAQAAGVVGDGTPGSCDEAALDAALAGGGLVTFNCHPGDLPIVVTSDKLITADTQIDGGGLVTLSGAGATGIFSVGFGVTLQLANITLSDGGGVSFGAAIDNGGGIVAITNSAITGHSATLGGGAILNAPGGVVLIIRSSFTGNSADTGGAIFNDVGTVTILRSTFNDNSAEIGGAIFNSPGATLDITNSTFSENSASSNGGALANAGAGTATLTASTLSANSATNSGGALINDPGSAMSVSASIVAENFAPGGPNCLNTPGTFTTLGSNLSDDASCGFGAASDIQNSANVNLAPLADNGGPTQTMLPQLGSDALDNAACLVFDDQRGVSRPQGASCDIGAVEIKQVAKARVTGAGWIDSPAGAYAPAPRLSGKATFSFTARHTADPTAPAGQTRFKFHAGGLKFTSSSYESLSVTENGAQFLGTGTINGLGAYGFRVSATDGSPDTFRIQIWDAITGEPVYDNGSAQALGGGSIVIKSK